jgi:hypothetical protein
MCSYQKVSGAERGCSIMTDMFYRIVSVGTEEVGALSGRKLEIFTRQCMELLYSHHLTVGGI